MEDGADLYIQAEPDVDGIRHVNQFGRPSVPVMEIACIPEKLDLVQNFFRDKNITTWDNINPSLESNRLTPLTTPKTLNATEKRISPGSCKPGGKLQIFFRAGTLHYITNV